MADVPMPGYQTLWMNKLSALKSENQTLVQQYHGAYTVTLQELEALIKARTLADQTNIPKTHGNKQRRRMVSKKYGGGSGAPPTKPPELQRKRYCRPNRRPP
jgi:hypothetical protein